MWLNIRQPSPGGETTFQYWVDQLGYNNALKVSARPGHSEHQLGLAIDFKTDQGGVPWAGGDWALTPAGSWMKANAWKFGWVLSYPRNEFSKVCYSYEPWHYRYLGRDLAKKVHESGLTVRQYLWANFTTAAVPPAPIGSPAPGGSPRPSGKPAAAPTIDPGQTLEPSPTLGAGGGPTEAPAPALTAGPAPMPTIEPTSQAGPLDGAGGTTLAIVAAAAVIIIAMGSWLGSRRFRSRNRRGL